LEVLRNEAGWSAILRLEQLGEGEIAERLLDEVGVVVHPGSFYGIAGMGRVVISLLGSTEDFQEGIKRLRALQR
jgi:aspartate/methionine/tyrosine aminotransferase